jgi:hypothetical protein
VSAEWQFTVAQLGSTMVAAMNDHLAGRSSVEPPQPTPARTVRTANDERFKQRMRRLKGGSTWVAHVEA